MSIIPLGLLEFILLMFERVQFGLQHGNGLVPRVVLFINLDELLPPGLDVLQQTLILAVVFNLVFIGVVLQLLAHHHVLLLHEVQLLLHLALLFP